MTETKNTTKPEQNKSKKSLKELQDLILNVIEDAESTDDPDEREQLLHHCSRFQKKLLNKNSVRVDLMIGLSEWEKRANRRATRKPLSVRKARNLAEDLHQLATIFKI